MKKSIKTKFSTNIEKSRLEFKKIKRLSKIQKLFNNIINYSFQQEQKSV